MFSKYLEEIEQEEASNAKSEQIVKEIRRMLGEIKEIIGLDGTVPISISIEDYFEEERSKIVD